MRPPVLLRKLSYGKLNSFLREGEFSPIDPHTEELLAHSTEIFADGTPPSQNIRTESKNHETLRNLPTDKDQIVG